MNDTPLQQSPITLDRRLLLGETDYQVTAFPTEDHRIDLCIVSTDGDGQVISEISGGLAPHDLAPLTDVLTSTLAGLIAMTQPPPSTRPAPPPDRRGRHPNQGARWTPEDDAALTTLFRSHPHPRLRDLATRFGRSPTAIRARLDRLAELPATAPWPAPVTPTAPAASAPGSPPSGGASPSGSTAYTNPTSTAQAA
ncbi:SANT/Myb-like DNA-binding domain-containing protein [Actinoplanes sp. CA-030573]|uniref:SANT/Myb-like DNA-binding domain-containing protein n=1 Tax=Actinoplanes sp. CA-030573 TaxID=3239898 RepID=UPI003D8F9121